MGCASPHTDVNICMGRALWEEGQWGEEKWCYACATTLKFQCMCNLNFMGYGQH